MKKIIVSLLKKLKHKYYSWKYKKEITKNNLYISKRILVYVIWLKYLNTLDVNMFIVNKKRDIFDIYVLINTSGPYNPDSERNSIIEVINRLRSKQNHFMSIVVNDERDNKLSYDYYKNNLYNDGKKCYIDYQLLISYYIMINYYFKTYKKINEKEK